MLIDRRTMLKIATAGSGLAATSAQAVQSAPASTATPPQAIGPFYPIVGPGENRADLVHGDRSARAQGQLVEVRGAVRTIRGEPVRSAIVLVWQANASGAYNHPRNAFGTPDPAFLGRAIVRTDRAGEFSLLTVRPGSYPDMPGTMRTPHIHFEVIGEEARLITQMYFPDEPLNAADRLLRELQTQGGNPSSLIATTSGESSAEGAARLSWTVLLDRA